jgi:hypothetical protein
MNRNLTPERRGKVSAAAARRSNWIGDGMVNFSAARGRGVARRRSLR